VTPVHETATPQNGESYPNQLGSNGSISLNETASASIWQNSENLSYCPFLNTNPAVGAESTPERGRPISRWIERDGWNPPRLRAISNLSGECH
jgi:hypothetical protein